ncbi:hypothetical protein [Nocardia cyriacigeorgica]|uniref:hypothetical protein n=1 Tax=Nocardia cyriacigeorgica TaxID=135487 RepID=UPI002458C9BA|nr:hypothetical protein [Nocardia cyriacigeorgica]
MRSLEDRYRDLIAAAKRLGPEPEPARLADLRDELDLLDYEIRVSVPAGTRYYELNKASKQAHTILTHADSRELRARSIAEVEQAREIHAAQHPTVLDRDPIPGHPFAGLVNRDRGRGRGFSR